jgi:hypothetical protein
MVCILSLINRSSSQEAVTNTPECTLGEYIAKGYLDRPQIIKVGTLLNNRSIVVGDATLWHQPSLSDAGIGWQDKELLSKPVVEVLYLNPDSF